MIKCPLCENRNTVEFARVQTRAFLKCSCCRLIFADPDSRPTAETERARYARHRNDPADKGYGEFLLRLVDPMVERLSPGADGLDFGAGESGVLASLFMQRGFKVQSFDPFVSSVRRVLDEQYEFISCCEAAEHFHDPRGEFARLNGMLKPGGLLGVMTQFVESEADFEDWWYARDATHVSFFHLETMEWIAGHFGWEIEFAPRSVTLFRKLSS